MKFILNTICVLLLFLSSIQAQEPTTTFSTTLSVQELDDQAQIVIKNINGELKVEGYEGTEILIEGVRELWKERGNVSRAEANDFYIDSRIYNGNIYVFVQAPGVEIDFENDRMNYSMNWNDQRNAVRFNFDLTVKVPQAMFLKASTVNGGELLIQGMKNGVHGSNVNGKVTIKETTGAASANTVNGDIVVHYVKSPVEETTYHTVNGSIEIFTPDDFGGVIFFESMHGELYTNFEQVTRLPNTLNKTQHKDGQRYRINSTTPIQIGQGGANMSFNLVNGSAYIKKREL